MKVPIYCPVCNDVMVNEYRKRNGKNNYAHFKYCQKRPDHRLYLKVNPKEEKLCYISVLYLNNKLATWDFELKEFNLTSNENTVALPFFEPDFSNFGKLLEKIETYILFL